MAKKYGRFQLQGFRWGKAHFPQSWADEANKLPTIWDPDTSAIPNIYWKYGVGGRNDLKLDGFVQVVESGVYKWRPQVNHGYYYFGRYQHYMYSDGGIIEHFSTADTDAVNSGNMMEFSFIPKLGVPILARQYDRVTSPGDLRVYREFATVPYFRGKFVNGEEQSTWDGSVINWSNVDRDEPEMMVIYKVDAANSGVVTVSGVLNSDYIFDVGADPISSGTWDVLYYLGMSDGEPYQSYTLPYAPVESGTCHIYVYNSGVSPSAGYEFEVVNNWAEMEQDKNQCVVDRDLGYVYFGDGQEHGAIPSGNYLIGCYYRCTIAVEYERENTTDLLTVYDTELAQFRRSKPNNFLMLTDGPPDPATLTLTADLPTMSPTYGPLRVGNIYALLRAEVKDTSGTPVEGQEVEFYFTDTKGVDCFIGEANTYSASNYSNSDGEAYSRIISPASIHKMAEIVTQDQVIASNKIILKDITPSGELNDIYTYAVYADDQDLGYYNSNSGVMEFLVKSGIIVNSGDYIIDPETGTRLDTDWEIYRRIVNGLPTVKGLDNVSADYYKQFGRKKIVSIYDAAAVNPHTGQLGAYMPLLPTSAESTSSGVILTYPANLPAINSGVVPSGIVWYYVVAPATVQLQAKTYNRKRSKWIYSNSIDVYIGPGDEGKGVYYFDAVNKVLPSGVIDSGVVVSSGYIPFGWRLRSDNPLFTAAAALSMMTFVDINS